jgi:glycerol-1-phosphate dehydrogenase [NAD(P)+]
MSYLGNSRSASGSEHLLSHFFEDLGMINGERYLPHGIDVAYSTYITTIIRNKLLKAKFPKTTYQIPREIFVNEMNSMFLDSAKKLITQQDEFDFTIENRALSYKFEGEIKKILKPASNYKKIQKYINDIGLNLNEFYNIYSKDKIDKAIIYAKNVRTRFTVLHLYLDVFKTENLNLKN